MAYGRWPVHDPYAMSLQPLAITLILNCELYDIARRVAHDMTALDRFEGNAGRSHPLHDVRDRRLGRQLHREVAQADRAWRRGRRADARPRVEADVMVIAAGR